MSKSEKLILQFSLALELSLLLLDGVVFAQRTIVQAHTNGNYQTISSTVNR